MNDNTTQGRFESLTLDEQIDKTLQQLHHVIKGKYKMSKDEFDTLKGFLDNKQNLFTEKQRTLYEDIDRYQLGKGIIEDLEKKGVRFQHLSKGKGRYIIAGALGGATLVGVGYGIYQNVSVSAHENKDTTIGKGIEKQEDQKTKKEQKSTLTEDKVKEIYGEYADTAAHIVETARINGLALESDEISHLMLIANLPNLTNAQKYELASSRHPVTIHDWMNFTDKVFIDCMDITSATRPFDASLLFGDTESAKDANYVMETFAQWNTKHDLKLRDEFKNFLTSYTEDENFQQKLKENPAAVEFVLKVSSLATDGAMNLLDNDEFTDSLFYSDNCKLSEARKALGADLQINQRLFKDFSIQITDKSMSETETLQKNIFLREYDDNKILQLKFIANQMDLTCTQEQDLANKLNLEDALDTWLAFGKGYASAIEFGMAFDANELFLNDHKAASELNKAQSIYQEYLKADDTRKAELYNEWNDFYYRVFRDEQQGIRESNKPASFLLAQLLQKASQNGLTLEKVDTNGITTKGLYDSIVGKGLTSDFCNTIDDVTINADGIQIYNRTDWEESYEDILSSLRSVTITSDKKESNANISLYEQIVREGRATTEIEEQQGINRHDIFVEMIEERVKDFDLQNVTDPKAVMSAKLDAMDIRYGGFIGGSIKGVGDITLADQSGVTIQGSGSETRDPNLELWTQDQINNAEKEANASKGQIIGTVFEDAEDQVIEEIKKNEIIFTDKDKDDNQTAVDNGYITEAEKDEMDKNQEHFEGNIDYEYSHNFSEEDVKLLIAASDKYEKAEKDYIEGKISEEEYEQALRDYDKTTNDIYAKYENNSSNKDEVSNEKDDQNNSLSKEQIIKDYGINLNDSFEYEGETYYFSEKEGCYVTLSMIFSSNEVVDSKVEQVEPEVKDETVLSEEDTTAYSARVVSAVENASVVDEEAVENQTEVAVENQNANAGDSGQTEVAVENQNANAGDSGQTEVAVENQNANAGDSSQTEVAVENQNANAGDSGQTEVAVENQNANAGDSGQTEVAVENQNANAGSSSQTEVAVENQNANASSSSQTETTDNSKQIAELKAAKDQLVSQDNEAEVSKSL